MIPLLDHTNLTDIETYYRIEEDGKVWSLSKDRYLTPHFNSCGYIQYPIFGHPVFSHKLVAFKYLGPKPEGHEINHIDGDKTNNHYSNLEWVTKSENIRKSYAMGRRCHWRDDPRGPCSDATKEKMSERKKKRVLVDGVEYRSIEEALVVIGTYRRRFNYYLKKGGLIKGHVVEVLGVL